MRKRGKEASGDVSRWRLLNIPNPGFRTDIPQRADIMTAESAVGLSAALRSSATGRERPKVGSC